MIWAVTHNADHRGRRAIVVRMGGTRTHTGQAQTAGRQRGRRKSHEYSLHKPGMILLGSVACAGNSPKSRRLPHCGSFLTGGSALEPLTQVRATTARQSD